MRYQQQQKGLFTFYKEQEMFQLQIQLLKNKRKQAQNQKMQAQKKNPSLNLPSSKRYSPQKFKLASQPSNNDDDSEHFKVANTNVQRFGNSIVVVNRKLTEQRKHIKSGRQQSYQQKSKQSGYFIENKNVQFSQLQKSKQSAPLLLHKRKRTYLKSVDYCKQQQKERKTTNLPTLMKVQEAQAEQSEQIPNITRINKSSLRYNGGELMKYIRNNLHSECDNNYMPEKSVSYIEFSKGYAKQSSPKKLQGLNQQQKRLLDILWRYRKSQK